MPFVELTLKSIEDLDEGRVAKAFLHHLKRMVQDCMDRPKEKKSRNLQMELRLKPIVNGDEDAFRVTVGLDLEIDVGNQKFILRPMPDEIEAATARALEDIRGRLAKGLPDSTILFGTP